MDIVLKRIPGHSDYAASADGRIWSSRRGEWRQLVQCRSGCKPDSYLKVKFNGVTQYKVHRLIALVFLGERQPGQVINHLDGNKRNNAVSNLEYCSYRDNMLHAHRMGLTVPAYTYQQRPPRKLVERIDRRRRGAMVPSAKLTEVDVCAIRAQHSRGVLASVLAGCYGVSKRQVHRIVHGKRWAHVPMAESIGS